MTAHRVLHVITGLRPAGAELALLRLLGARDRTRTVAEVASLTSGGAVAEMLRAIDVPVHDLAMQTPAHAPSAVLRLRRLMRLSRTDVVQTWMHHADLVGGVAARLSGVPVVWGLRMGVVRRGTERPLTQAVARINALGARTVPNAIVACSAAVQADYLAAGYPGARMVVIPNGYAPAPPLPPSLRDGLGIPASAVVVGRIGRWHPWKDHTGFLRALGPLLQERPDLHVVLVGQGVDDRNDALRQLALASGAAERVHLLGERRDMWAVYATLDVLCSSSSAGEGFPNVIAEAYLAGVPVVTTDVGESAAIVGPHGLVVAPSDPAALEGALRQVVAMPAAARAALGARGRESVLSRYGLPRMVAAYADLHEQVAQRRFP